MSSILMLDRKILRFAIYVRGADSSHELLLRMYREIIRQRHLGDPETFSFVRFYSDEEDEDRELKRLIEDCESGKVDIILTGPMTDFCKNIEEILAIARKLRSLPNPVGIWFDRDGIFTLDDKGDLFLSILAVVTEEE